MRRRALLATVGLGSLGVVGGTMAYEPPALREVTIRNRTDTTWTIEVRILADGDLITDEAHELAPEEHRQLSCDWPGAARTFRIAARLDIESEWTERTVSSGGDHCRWFEITDDNWATGSETDAILLKRAGPCPPTEAHSRRNACDTPTWSRVFRTL